MTLGALTMARSTGKRARRDQQSDNNNKSGIAGSAKVTIQPVKPLNYIQGAYLDAIKSKRII